MNKTSSRKAIFALIGGVVLATTLAAGAQVVVRIGPPPPRPYEVVPPPPPEHPGWAWHAGYHEYDGRAYHWHPGYYAQPPYAHARWVNGHWAHRGGGYVFVEGHWAR